MATKRERLGLSFPPFQVECSLTTVHTKIETVASMWLWIFNSCPLVCPKEIQRVCLKFEYSIVHQYKGQFAFPFVRANRKLDSRNPLQSLFFPCGFAKHLNRHFRDFDCFCWHDISQQSHNTGRMYSNLQPAVLIFWESLQNSTMTMSKYVHPASGQPDLQRMGVCKDAWTVFGQGVRGACHCL